MTTTITSPLGHKFTLVPAPEYGPGHYHLENENLGVSKFAIWNLDGLLEALTDYDTANGLPPVP